MTVLDITKENFAEKILNAGETCFAGFICGMVWTL